MSRVILGLGGLAFATLLSGSAGCQAQNGGTRDTGARDTPAQKAGPQKAGRQKAGPQDSLALDRYRDAPPAQVWVLPRRLKEISGLATTADGRIFAHDDERAVIYQLDPRARRVVKSFVLAEANGKPALGDFEGLAIAGERFFLITSHGVLYETREGAADDRVAFTVHPTHFGRLCEIEGLAYDPAERALLAACKLPRAHALRGWVTVLRWLPDQNRPAPSGPIRVPLDAVRAAGGLRGFHPSGIERDPETGHLLLVASAERAVLELGPTGTVLAARRLTGRHPQAEGITVGEDGTLFVADEGPGGAATVTLYPPAPVTGP